MATPASSNEKIETLPRHPWLNQSVKAKNSPGTTEVAYEKDEGMNSSLIELVAILGAFFGFFGGIMAFIIAYDEYTRHFRDKSKPFWMAFEMAVLAFLVFVALSIIVGFVLSNAFASQVPP